jgi:hypothetical protein
MRALCVCLVLGSPGLAAADASIRETAPSSVVARSQDDPGGLLADERYLWRSTTAGIVRAAKRDGAAELFVAAAKVQCLDHDDRFLYYVDPRTHEIRRVRKDGGAPEPFVRDGEPECVVTVAKHQIYWQRQDGSLMRTPVDGGPSIQLTGDAGFIMNVVTDGQTIWFSSDEGVFVTPYRGGTARRIADRSYSLALDGDFLYFEEGDQTPRLVRMRKSGGRREQLGQVSWPWAVRDGEVWFIDDFRLFRLRPGQRAEPRGRIAGMPPQQIRPDDLIVDDEFAYWLSVGVLDVPAARSIHGTGAVGRLAR